MTPHGDCTGAGALGCHLSRVGLPNKRNGALGGRCCATTTGEIPPCHLAAS